MTHASFIISSLVVLVLVCGVNGGTNCLEGNYWKTPDNYCERCPLGTSNPNPTSAGISVCVACPVGSWSAHLSGTQGPITCTPCAPGQYAEYGVTTQCEDCSAGTASNPAGALSDCENCDPGYYSGASYSECDPCLEGTYQPSGGQATCLTVDYGEWTAEAATVPEECAVGYSSNPPFDSCTICPAGSWNGVVGKGSGGSAGTGTCQSCAAGTFSSSPGATSASDCQLCPRNTYSSSPGASFCTPCSAGTELKTQGSTSSLDCTPCPAGTSSLEGGPCEPCAAGSFSDSPGASACELCPDDYVAELPGSAECIHCIGEAYTNGPGEKVCLQPSNSEAVFYASSGLAVVVIGIGIARRSRQETFVAPIDSAKGNQIAGKKIRKRSRSTGRNSSDGSRGSKGSRSKKKGGKKAEVAGSNADYANDLSVLSLKAYETNLLATENMSAAGLSTGSRGSSGSKSSVNSGGPGVMRKTSKGSKGSRGSAGRARGGSGGSGDGLLQASSTVMVRRTSSNSKNSRGSQGRRRGNSSNSKGSRGRGSSMT